MTDNIEFLNNVHQLDALGQEAIGWIDEITGGDTCSDVPDALVVETFRNLKIIIEAQRHFITMATEHMLDTSEKIDDVMQKLRSDRDSSQ